MIKGRLFGIYGKVFSYTILILLFVIFFMFAFFFDQIKSVVESTQREQLSEVFQPLLDHLDEKSNDEIIGIAKNFHEKNTSFEFCLEASDGQILFQTANFTMPKNEIVNPPPGNVMVKGKSLKEYKFLNIIPAAPNRHFQFVMIAPRGVKLYVTGINSGI